MPDSDVDVCSACGRPSGFIPKPFMDIVGEWKEQGREIIHLREVRVRLDLAQAENQELKDEVNRMRLKAAGLAEAIEGMTTDMSLMEATIWELSGKDPDGFE